MSKINEEMALSLGGKSIFDEVFETNLKDRKIFLNQEIVNFSGISNDKYHQMEQGR
jgi:hypothetical protein